MSYDIKLRILHNYITWRNFFLFAGTTWTKCWCPKEFQRRMGMTKSRLFTNALLMWYCPVAGRISSQPRETVGLPDGACVMTGAGARTSTSSLLTLMMWHAERSLATHGLAHVLYLVAHIYVFLVLFSAFDIQSENKYTYLLIIILRTLKVSRSRMSSFGFPGLTFF